MKQHPCVQCGVLVESMAPPQNTWCEECYEVMNGSEFGNTPPPPPSVSLHSTNYPQAPPFNNPLFNFMMGGHKHTCEIHPDGCPPYDPSKYNQCFEENNSLSDIVEITFA